MVTLSENNSEQCSSSSTNTQIGSNNETRQHFSAMAAAAAAANSAPGNNGVSSTSSENVAGSAAGSNPVTPVHLHHHQNPHGIWDLANPDIGYELAASSAGNSFKNVAPLAADMDLFRIHFV